MREPVLESERLRLRPIRESDVADFHAQWAHPSVRRYLFDDTAPSLAQVRELVATSDASFAAQGFGLWSLVPHGESDPIGCCGLRPTAAEPELLYVLARDAFGAGLGLEAARAVLGYAFGALGLLRVCASVDDPNAASVRILERLGMRLDRQEELAGRPTRFYGVSRGEFSAASSGRGA
ncbi:MAG: GNAT family N-acetyltransferase [Proteobacteria bacterium]|nr:GNAT family N-acetyltransferase [Pseudomonadota bacterium]